MEPANGAPMACPCRPRGPLGASRRRAGSSSSLWEGEAGGGNSQEGQDLRGQQGQPHPTPPTHPTRTKMFSWTHFTDGPAAGQSRKQVDSRVALRLSKRPPTPSHLNTLQRRPRMTWGPVDHQPQMVSLSRCRYLPSGLQAAASRTSWRPWETGPSPRHRRKLFLFQQGLLQPSLLPGWPFGDQTGREGWSKEGSGGGLSHGATVPSCPTLAARPEAMQVSPRFHSQDPGSRALPRLPHAPS